MVNAVQAAEIREHLIRQLTENGFGELIRETVTRLDFDNALDYRQKPTYALNQFIEQLIAVFASLSNSNYELILSTLNNALADGLADALLVQPTNDNEEPIDLRSLPDYSGIIAGFREIQTQIIAER